MPKLKAVVIGAGIMGKNHARIYAELEDAELVGVVDVNEEQGSAIANQHGCSYYSDCEAFLKKQMPDVASVCVPTHLHAKIAIPLMKQGINVLVEKPIASSIKEAQDIIEEATKNDIVLMIGHVERFNPVILELKKRITEGELGRIFQVTSQRMSPFPKRVLDVGVGIDLAVHDVDIMRYLLGAEIKNLYALNARRIHSTNEDLLVGTMEFSNGALGLINCNWITPKIVRELTIIGEKGMFVANYLTQELCFYKNESADKSVDWAKGIMDVRAGEMIAVAVNKSEPLRNELSAFIDAVRQKKPSPMPGKDGLKALEVVLNFLESAKSKKGVSL